MSFHVKPSRILVRLLGLVLVAAGLLLLAHPVPALAHAGHHHPVSSAETAPASPHLDLGEAMAEARLIPDDGVVGSCPHGCCSSGAACCTSPLRTAAPSVDRPLPAGRTLPPPNARRPASAERTPPREPPRPAT